jgi:TRAP-type C4-dicarboxylate transport system substrate-binding protein
MRGVLALALWFGIAATGTPVAAQQIVLKLSHFLGPDSFFQRDFAEPWAKELEELSGGRLKVEIANAASPYGEVTKQAEQVLNGTIDIALGLRGAEGDRFLRSSIIELPFVVQNALDGSRALWELYKSGELDDEYKDFKVLALFVHNPGLIHTTFKRIVVPEDLKGQRLRVPNKTVAAALQSLGATPAILQVNDVMPAIKDFSLDGVVTNWGNPLPDFNHYLKHHTDIAFYTSAFFVVMNQQRYASLPPDIRAAIDKVSYARLVTRFGLLWNKWDRPVREAAVGPDQEVIVPDDELMAQWRNALQPFADKYVDGLVAGGFTGARAVYQKLLADQTKQP